MPESNKKFTNPVVIKDYRGFTIRKYTKIQIRITVDEAKRIIDAKLDHDLSAKQVIERRLILCPECPQGLILPIKNDKSN